jgi:hypothetical protein
MTWSHVAVAGQRRYGDAEYTLLPVRDFDTTHIYALMLS